MGGHTDQRRHLEREEYIVLLLSSLLEPGNRFSKSLQLTRRSRDPWGESMHFKF